ncbi:glycosyltransferase family 2 protein [Aliidiomarina celeris]|uniref:glycosyltransferase family 2 protein n=1 Tax=Aliidiomarina celeris TaxID=2249428 RepID=UPI000DE922A2|nr:glycosyltransferase family 2 protein [Aliidiomarina celeris]
MPVAKPYEPFISLVIPTRNRPDLVAYCLACIAAQTHTDYEVILSDNGTTQRCDAQFTPYQNDVRFTYVRPPAEMNMCDHWQFAVSFAKGEYVTILSEKFMLRPDALALLFQMAKQYGADIFSWQFERFEAEGNDISHGHYHPLMKPVAPTYYSPVDELKRRLSFDTPTFCRQLRHKTSYGKMYSGCVKRSILLRAQAHFGSVFQPYSPDYTSMIALLNESEQAIDVGQSLMIVVFASQISLGEASKVSLQVTASYCLEYNNVIADFTRCTLFPGAWVGHNSFIAYDYYSMGVKAQYGPLTTLTVNRTNLLSWLLTDIDDVSDWGGYDELKLRAAIDYHLSQFEPSIQIEILRRANEPEYNKPCLREIYHSGLTKLQDMPPNLTAEALAQMHWCDGVAPARKNVLNQDEGIMAAVEYCYRYNAYSCKLLNIQPSSIEHA